MMSPLLSKNEFWTCQNSVYVIHHYRRKVLTSVLQQQITPVNDDEKATTVFDTTARINNDQREKRHDGLLI